MHLTVRSIVELQIVNLIFLVLLIKQKKQSFFSHIFSNKLIERLPNKSQDFLVKYFCLSINKMTEN